ncbi:hypothetical protein [Salinibacterium sp. ZJ450]|uniref:hypothetical protein n=1 Tax=Salinibacterium sp. ZJ450 TaxID=2708338 RepID=UPI00142203AA|nr:hypothetical protein [Salinibacterium sp. ZJ450]
MTDRTDPSREPQDGDPSELDDVFGETAFRDYSDEPVFTPSRSTRRESQPGRRQAEPAEPVGQTQGGFGQAADGKPDVAAQGHAPIPRNQQILLWIAGSLVAVLAIVALYFVGTRLGGTDEPAAVVTPSATAEPTPTSTPEAPAVGPLPAGVYDWSELLGGECIDPYTDPWAEEFTVVDCAVPHPAQLVDRGTFPMDAANPSYPGVDGLQTQINLLCSAPTVIDFAAAGQFSDIQVQASYAATAEEWDAGHHDYFCFATRSSGEPLTVSVAVPQQ